ncbi:MAG: hypothetical protein VX583_11770 [Bdellovibrionota bacterium]|nr:hypothetical protein [Pseudobdellovibrionaceae bacterium]|tara:strand:- start:31693 stop:32871 length:1179 start_codon:yes stop_codon:yes gene_type:complete
MKKFLIPLVLMAQTGMADLPAEGHAAVPAPHNAQPRISQLGPNYCGENYDKITPSFDYYQSMQISDPNLKFYMDRHYSCNNIVDQLNELAGEASIYVYEGDLKSANDSMVSVIFQYAQEMQDDDFYRDPATVIAITQSAQILRSLLPSFGLYPENEVVNRLNSNTPSIPGRTYTPSNIQYGTTSLVLKELMDIINYAYDEVDSYVAEKIQRDFENGEDFESHSFEATFLEKAASWETYKFWSDKSSNSRSVPSFLEDRQNSSRQTLDRPDLVRYSPLTNYDKKHFKLAAFMYDKYQHIDQYQTTVEKQLDNVSAFARAMARVINNTRHRNNYTCIINELYYIADYAQFQKCRVNDYNKLPVITRVRRMLATQYGKLASLNSSSGYVNICGGH